MAMSLDEALIGLLAAITAAIGGWSAYKHKKSSANQSKAELSNITIAERLTKLESFQKVHREQFLKIEKQYEQTNKKLDDIFEKLNKELSKK